jgi:predicted Zn-dependent peptidase
MYQRTRLENGLTILTAEMPHMASVSLGIWVGVGGRYEPAELCGVSHFIEHMLFKGTRKRSALEISQAVEGIGGYFNAFTSEENTCFYSKVRHDCFDDLLGVLMDMFLNSRFEAGEIDKERSVIKEELAMYMDQPHQYVQELLNETLWPNQPLGRSLTGTVQTLDAMTRKEIVRYQRSNYVAPATLVTAAGRLRHKQVVKAVSRYAPRFRQGRLPQFIPAISNQKEPNLRLFTKAVEQTQLALGLRVSSRHDERRYALRLLSTILGENMSSRLFQTVREEHGLAYNIYSSLCLLEDAGLLNVSAGLDTDKLPHALELIMNELRHLAAKAPSRSEMQRARDYAIGQIDLSLEGGESQMMWLGEHYLAYGNVPSARQVKDRLSKVLPSEVRAVAREFFRPEALNLALVSPLKSHRSLVKHLNL